MAFSIYISTSVANMMSYVTLSYLFFFFRATSEAYGCSQARGQIEAVAAGLCHSLSHVGSEPLLRPTRQLVAMTDPYLTEQGQGSNPSPHGY